MASKVIVPFIALGSSVHIWCCCRTNLDHKEVEGDSIQVKGGDINLRYLIRSIGEKECPKKNKSKQK